MREIIRQEWNIEVCFRRSSLLELTSMENGTFRDEWRINTGGTCWEIHEKNFIITVGQ